MNQTLLPIRKPTLDSILIQRQRKKIWVADGFSLIDWIFFVISVADQIITLNDVDMKTKN
ncbi:hypothetical protein C1N51_27675 (plasmid) [Vibrio campbellii]|nr:hypothetical protein C1N51_27675 [Vibrio campbellii]